MTKKAALITGGSAGIGRAIAAMLVEEGWAVTICGRDQARLDAAAHALGGQVVAVTASLADTDAPERLTAQHLERFGTLDLLVNNVGIGKHGPIAEKTDNASDLDIAQYTQAAEHVLSSGMHSLTGS